MIPAENQHFTPKTNPLKRSDLDDFASYYYAENRHQRKEIERRGVSLSSFNQLRSQSI
jgi:hypothetical protein